MLELVNLRQQKHLYRYANVTSKATEQKYKNKWYETCMICMILSEYHAGMTENLNGISFSYNLFISLTNSLSYNVKI